MIFRLLQQKNHTGRNATVKAHKNGIKKANKFATKSLKGVSAALCYYTHPVVFIVPGYVCYVIISHHSFFICLVVDGPQVSSQPSFL